MSRKILIIDDDEVMLEGMKIALEDEGYEVYLLSNNTNVLGEVKRFKPSLILIDYWMPGINGGEITQGLKENNHTSKVPVIMISASQNAATIADDAGADDFIAKPFDLDELVGKVRKHLP